METSASSTSALTQLPPEALELDRSALREVKRRGAPGGRKAAAVHPSARQAIERVTQEEQGAALHPGRWPLYGAALLALYLCAVMLTSLTDGLPAPARVLIGLLPGVMAVGLSAGTHAHRAGGAGPRWLVPSSLYCLAMLAGTVVLTLLVFPGRAEIAFKHEGVWLLSALPDVAPLTSLKAATASLMQALASACAQIGPALPWG